MADHSHDQHINIHYRAMQGKRSDCIRNLGRGVDETWGMCTRNKSVGKKDF